MTGIAFVEIKISNRTNALSLDVAVAKEVK